MGGASFAGIASGPIFGALLIRWTDRVLTPFYVTLALHLTFLLLAVIYLPETLSKTRQREARERRRLEHEKRREEEKHEDEEARTKGPWFVTLLRLRRYASRPWGFLKPLKMLLPRKRLASELEEDKPVMDSHGKVTTGWDFSLVKIGIAAACYGLALVSFSMPTPPGCIRTDLEPHMQSMIAFKLCRRISSQKAPAVTNIVIHSVRITRL